MEIPLRYAVLCLLLVGTGCIGAKRPAEKVEVQRAWALMETGDLDGAIVIAREFLDTNDAEAALAIAHLYNERAVQEGDYPIERRVNDRRCFIAMLERSAVLGDLGAASTLSASFTLTRRYIERDAIRGKCWDEVVETGKDPQACIQPSALDVCK